MAPTLDVHPLASFLRPLLRRGMTGMIAATFLVAFGCVQEAVEVAPAKAESAKAESAKAESATAPLEPRRVEARAEPRKVALIRGPAATLPEGLEDVFLLTRPQLREEVALRFPEAMLHDREDEQLWARIELVDPGTMRARDAEGPVQWLTLTVPEQMLATLTKRWGPAHATSEGRLDGARRLEGTHYHWYDPEARLAAHLQPGILSPHELVFNPYLPSEELPARLLEVAKPMIGTTLEWQPGMHAPSVELPAMRGHVYPTRVASPDIPHEGTLVVRSLTTSWEPERMDEVPEAFERAFGDPKETCSLAPPNQRVRSLLYEASLPIVLREREGGWSITVHEPPASRLIDRSCLH